MKVKGVYILGTVKEIAGYTVQNVLDKGYVNAKEKFIRCDFSIIDDCEKENDIVTIAMKANGWYGIEKLATSFDNGCGLDIFADYYGGGSGAYDYISDGISAEECLEIVKDVILKTLKYDNECDENTLLIAERRYTM